MRNRKEHVTLPIQIPQNIIDMFIEYREWRKDQSKYPNGHKDIMLKKFEGICRKWHLWSMWENCAGSFFIHLKNGIVVYTHINEDKPLVIHQCSSGNQYNPWNNKYPQEKEGKYGKQKFVYDWSNYEDTTIK
jgi:hypothetical protein